MELPSAGTPAQSVRVEICMCSFFPPSYFKWLVVLVFLFSSSLVILYTVNSGTGVNVVTNYVVYTPGDDGSTDALIGRGWMVEIHYSRLPMLLFFNLTSYSER